MDPLIISLIFQGLRLAAQVATQGVRAKEALNDLEVFLLKLHQENRLPTPEEMAQWTERTASLDRLFASKVKQLEAIIAQGGGPIPVPPPEPVVDGGSVTPGPAVTDEKLS